MSTFVLVHGSKHGGWCWKRVAEGLRGQGHEVYCPSLSGVGERAHLAESAVINLETHILDISELLFFEDLRHVLLVGHSYGGMVITGVADRVPERVGHLVYLDAVVPHDGESHFDLVSSPVATALRDFISSEGRGLLLPPAATPPQQFGVTEAKDIEWVRERLTSQPAATFEQRLALKGSAIAVPRTYVKCLESSIIDQLVLERVRSDSSFQWTEIAAGHDAMITAPDLLADTLLRIAQRQTEAILRLEKGRGDDHKP